MSTAAERRRWIAGVVAAALVLTACWGGDDDDDPSAGTDPTRTTVPDDVEPVVTVEGGAIEPVASRSLGLRLSEGEPTIASTEPVTLAEGTPLTDDEIDAIVARLPEWNIPADDQVDFNRPADTLLPPTVGDTIDQPFPPDVAEPPDPLDVPPDGPLEVMRFQPEGNVDLAPFIAMTFSEPMVPLSTVEQLDDADVPATITPAVDGRWRWIGTRTLRFELVPGVLDRLPAATTFEVTVPAGTSSANGAVLDDDVSWTFETPTPTIRTLAGVSDSMRIRPVWIAVFDQRVEPDAVLDHIEVRVGDAAVAIRLATEEEIAEAELDRVVEDALEARSVAFTPLTELPVDAAVDITVGPGVPSAEGPNTSSSTERFSGRTFGALRIDRTDCDWGDGCVPGIPLTIEFSNPLDTAELDADQVTEWVQVSPAIPDLTIDVAGNYITLRGATAGRTTYRVTLGGEITDVFGQRLGEDTTVTFDVESSPPILRGLEREFITTDPSAETPSVSIVTVNQDAVRVQAWAVTPDRYDEFRDYLDRLWQDEDAEVPEWSQVLDTEIDIDAERDRFTETFIDLSEAFDQAGSQLVVRVDSLLDLSRNDDDYWRNRPTVAWVQNTQIGIDAISDDERLVIVTSDLQTGAPRGGVPVELIGDGRVATTDDDGIAEIELSDAEVTALWANGGAETAFMPNGYWRRSQRGDDANFYVFDDRGIYRPGETAYLKGWVRRFTWSEGARLELLDGDVSVEIIARDAQGAELANEVADLNALGGFDAEIEIPAGANLGGAWVEFSLVGAPIGGRFDHTFQIQEFRRPEFEVTTRVETPAPHIATEPATTAVNASYFAGGPLPDAEVTWFVATSDATYSPPNWGDYQFGVWQPWWWYGDVGGGFATNVAYEVASDECFDCGPWFGDTTYEEFAGRTDAGGNHYLRIDFDATEVDLPSSVTAEATVFDVDRQAWSSRSTLLVHSGRNYVGIRADRNFVRPGTPIRVDAVVTDIDGELTVGRDVTMTAGRLTWVFANGDWTEQLVDEQSCEFNSTATVDDESMRCEFDTEIGGTYRITAVVADEAGRPNRSEITQWVSGGPGRPNRGVDEEAVTIVPDRSEYAPGDVAEVLIQAPFAPAYGVVTVARDGIETVEPFEAEDGSAVVEVPITEEHVPNVHVRVDVSGSATRFDDNGVERDDLPPRPAYAVGSISLPVPPVTRELDVVATPATSMLEPGDTTSVTVTVADADGGEVEGADVAIVVVDEAVLSLTGYELPDPIGTFYREINSGLRGSDLRSSILLAAADQFGEGDSANRGTDDADFAAEEPASEAADDGGADLASGRAGAGDAIDLRSDFDALAVFVPDATTGPDGQVTIDVPLPDNLTRYRVMAVAASGADRFGAGESSITARLPLMVRASAPRFLNYGDRFELPLVLHNQTDEPIDVDVIVQAANLEIIGAEGQRVTVPANDRVEVRFPSTTDSAGTARLRVAAVSGSFADAAEFSLPVYTPSTSEAFATYGVVDEGAISQPLEAPVNVIPQFGALEIGTSSTALQALTDAVIYLNDYRYESSDGFASRIMAIAALRDVLEAFDAEGLPPAAELDAQVASDINSLVALQNDDGGWPVWQRGRTSDPWRSVQSAHALVLARDADYRVPADAVSRALDYLAVIEQHIPADWSDSARYHVMAYALYVRNEAGQPDASGAAALYRNGGDQLEADALAWIWPSITDLEIRVEIQRAISNAAVETPSAAAFATGYTEADYVIAQSDRRVDGIVLDALLTETPDSDLIPKVVNGLLGEQRRGRWNNAQENAFILLALHRYFVTFESIDPDFVARAWLGDLYVAEAAFEGRTTDRVNSIVPMSELISLTAPPDDPEAPAGDDDADSGDGSTSLVLAKDGDGRLYYRLGLTYAPADLRLDPRDEGFVVERSYEAVSDDDDVRRDGEGNWHITPGATVRVRVTMVADAPRANVALVDPLPAGLEPINPDLVVSQTIFTETGDDAFGDTRPGWWWSWFEHQNLRDDRAEAFAGYVYGGTYEYTYLARATTPGTFVTPPAKAEEIYSPEVFGRSATDIVVIE